MGKQRCKYYGGMDRDSLSLSLSLSLSHSPPSSPLSPLYLSLPSSLSCHGVNTYCYSITSEEGSEATVYYRLVDVSW